jgi:hypothetical protein
MKTKELLKSLTVNSSNINGMNGLFGKELKIIEPFIKELDEFKEVKHVEIECDFEVFTPSNNPSEKHIELVTCKLSDCMFSESILMYGLFISDDEVMIRCANFSLR